MDQISEYTYWVSCLAGAAMTYASFHYFMQRRITQSPAIKHHSELMMAFCFFLAVIIAILVSIPRLFRATL